VRVALRGRKLVVEAAPAYVACVKTIGERCRVERTQAAHDAVPL